MAHSSKAHVQQERDETAPTIGSQLIPLTLELSRQCLFPPGCLVFSMNDQNQQIGTVDSVFYDSSKPTRPFVYKVVNETNVVMVQESQVGFALFCPVWFLGKECIVLRNRDQSEQQLYSVLEVRTGCLFRSVQKTSITYRSECAAASNEATATLDSASNVSDTLTLPPSVALGANFVSGNETNVPLPSEKSVSTCRVLGDVTARHTNVQERLVSMKENVKDRGVPKNGDPFVRIESPSLFSGDDSRGKRMQQKKTTFGDNRVHECEPNRIEGSDQIDTVSMSDFFIPLKDIFTVKDLQEFDKKSATGIMHITGCYLYLCPTTTDEFIHYKLIGTRAEIEWASQMTKTLLIETIPVDHSLFHLALYYLERMNQRREEKADARIVQVGCLSSRLYRQWMYCERVPAGFCHDSHLVFGSGYLKQIERKTQCHVEFHDNSTNPHFVLYGDTDNAVKSCMDQMAEWLKELMADMYQW